MAKRAGLLDLGTGAGSNYRQAQRDAAAGASLEHIARTLDALLMVENQQTKLLTDIASMLWEQRQAQPRS